MSRKTTKVARKASASTGRTTASKTRTKTTKKTPTTPAERKTKAAKSPPKRKTTVAAKTASKKPASSARKKAPAATLKRSTPEATGKPAAAKAASADILAKAEADIRSAVESWTTQFCAAMETLTDLAVAQQGPAKAVRQNAPLDRATAMFQRLVTDMLDEQLSDVLPTLVALRGEMSQRLAAQSGDDAEDDSFYERGMEMLDQVLAGAHVARYEVQPGDLFDPLIHLAVGEDHRAELPNGAVAASLQPGYRTTGGKVISQARVKVNRR